jgi:hypothetical protein
MKQEEQASEQQETSIRQKTDPTASAQMSLSERQEDPPVVSEPSSIDFFGKEPDTTPQTSAAAVVPESYSFYALFLRRLQELTVKAPITLDDMLSQLDVCKTQLSDWLKRAQEEGHVKKLSKPVRYQWQPHKPQQPSFFDDQK